jgi:riboflavin kinase / FMN adenylyltransferase
LKVHASLETFHGNQPIVTMGTFDGVHPGHQALLKRVKNLALAENKESVVLTFWPHPRLVLGQDADSLRLLTSLDEKIQIISQVGIDHVIVVPFTQELASLSASEFLENTLVGQLNVGHLVIGFNHRFGKGGITIEEVFKLSRKLNFDISQFRHVDIDGQYPSSTRIRNFLNIGEIPSANMLLGYKYGITGRVTGGMQLGRKLAYPTANLILEEKAKLVPPDGVYACFVKVIGKYYGGMVNIGYRPTVNNQMDNRSIEVHILDFNQDIYSEEVTLQFVAKTRDEMRFSDMEALRTQLQQDEVAIRKILEKSSPDIAEEIINEI